MKLDLSKEIVELIKDRLAYWEYGLDVRPHDTYYSHRVTELKSLLAEIELIEQDDK